MELYIYIFIHEGWQTHLRMISGANEKGDMDKFSDIGFILTQDYCALHGLNVTINTSEEKE